MCGHTMGTLKIHGEIEFNTGSVWQKKKKKRVGNPSMVMCILHDLCGVQGQGTGRWAQAYFPQDMWCLSGMPRPSTSMQYF